MLKGTQSPNIRIYTSVVAMRRQQLFLKIELFLEIVNINFDILFSLSSNKKFTHFSEPS